MKYLIITLLCQPFCSHAQSNGKYEGPMLDGNKDGILTHIAKQLRYPDVARERGISGKAVFKFKVDTNGKIDSLTPLFSTHPSLEAETKRVIELSDGKWRPASLNGVPVLSWEYLPTSFVLDGDMETAKGNRIAKAYEYYKAGLAKYNEGLENDAIDALRAAYAVDHTNTAALYNVSLIYVNSGNYSIACFYLNKLKESKVLEKDMKKEVDNMLSLHCKD